VTKTLNIEGSFVSFFSQKFSHQYLTWGTNLRSENVIFLSIRKVLDRKIPF